MTQKILPLASLAAIAAVMACSQTALAQAPETAPPVEAVPLPTITPPASEPAPAPSEPAMTPQAVAPVYAPPSAVVQSVPQAQGPEPVAAQPAARAPARPAPAVTSAQRSPVSAQALQRSAPVVKPPPPAAVAPAPLVQPQAAPSPAATATSDDGIGNEELAYGIAAGGAILLLGSAVTVLALSRRQRGDTTRRRYAAPVLEPAAALAAPALTAPVVDAVVATPVTAQAMPRVRAATAERSAWPELEDMVAAQPDAANPFLTRRSRLRRAKFLLEHGEPQPLTLDQPQTSTEPAKVATPQIRTQPVYDFNRTQSPRRPTWKPATS